MSVVKSHERQLRAIANDYRAIAKSIDGRLIGATQALETCNGIVLLLTTAADDMEDLQLPEARA